MCVASCCASFLVPQRSDSAVIAALCEVYARFRPDRIESIADRMAAQLGGSPGEFRDEARGFACSQMELVWGIGRGMRKSGWHPSTRIFGADRLHQGLEAGRGVILWRMSLGPAVAVNRALSDAGHPPVHLSREDHLVPGQDWWSLRVAAPLMQRGEARSVAERVEIPVGGSLGYMRTILARLTANLPVTIVGDAPGAKARRPVAVPFLSGERRFPAGAPALAYRSGATLLPVYSIRRGPMTYDVIIEEAIPVGAGESRRAFEESAVAAYARLLEQAVRAHPQSWRGWRDPM